MTFELSISLKWSLTMIYATNAGWNYIYNQTPFEWPVYQRHQRLGGNPVCRYQFMKPPVAKNKSCRHYSRILFDTNAVWIYPSRVSNSPWKVFVSNAVWVLQTPRLIETNVCFKRRLSQSFQVNVVRRLWINPLIQGLNSLPTLFKRRSRVLNKQI